jgi:hypothetical protein
MKKADLILPVVAGTMVGMILQVFGEKLIHLFYPLPAGIDIFDRTAIAGFVASMPVSAFLLLLVNSMVCAFVAGSLSAVVSGRTEKTASVITGILLTVAGIFYIVKMPGLPMWYASASVFMQLPLAMVGFAVVRRRKNEVG